MDAQDVTLEKLIEIAAALRLPMPELVPNQSHALVYEGESSDPRRGRSHVEVDFVTGDGPAEVPMTAPTVHGHTDVRGSRADHACADVIDAQDLFDAGQHILRSFDVSGVPGAVGWLVFEKFRGGIGLATAWPASCGPPTLYVGGGRSSCYDLYVIGPSGHVSPGTRYCLPFPEAQSEQPLCYVVADQLPGGAYGPEELVCASASSGADSPADSAESAAQERDGGLGFDTPRSPQTSARHDAGVTADGGAVDAMGGKDDAPPPISTAGVGSLARREPGPVRAVVGATRSVPDEIDEADQVDPSAAGGSGCAVSRAGSSSPTPGFAWCLVPIALWVSRRSFTCVGAWKRSGYQAKRRHRRPAGL